MADKKYTFASDNVAGLQPESLAIIQAADTGCVAAYGDDAYTQEAEIALVRFFQRKVFTYPVFNGTAANVLCLSALVKPYEAIACHGFAHADLDECNAPEFFTGGAKLIPIAGDAGKICPKALEAKIKERDDVHFPKIAALTLTLSSEVGTVYTLEELAALKDVAKKYGLSIHIDGARFFNALVHLKCDAGEFVDAAGADALSLGLVKNGAALGECVVFFDATNADGFAYRRKQAAQLCSKMRYITAPIADALPSRCLQAAQHANACAQRLGQAFETVGIRPVFPVEANAVFVRLSEAMVAGLRERGWVFYDFVEGTHRFVCHWATQQSDLEALISDLEECA